MPQRPMTTLGTAASVSTSAVTGARMKCGASSLRKSAIPIASGVASRSAKNDVMTVPKMKLPAPKSSWPTTGFHAMRVTKPRPYFESDEARSVDQLPDDEADEGGRSRARPSLRRSGGSGRRDAPAAP